MINLVFRSIKRGDQALISISKMLKFSALVQKGPHDAIVSALLKMHKSCNIERKTGNRPF